MKLFLSAIICAGFLVIGCAQSEAPKESEKADATASKLQAVTQDFFQLKNQGLLVGLDKNATGGRASFFPVDDSIRTQAWFADIKEKFSQCKTGYVANVEIGNRELFYLLSYDSGHPEIIGNYQEQNGRLIPLKPQ